MTNTPLYRALIFDLDGTLVDSRLDLANAVNEMLGRFELPELAADTILRFVGRGIRRLVRGSLDEAGGVSIDSEQGLRSFSEIYGERLVENTCPYPGVKETLKRLENLRMAVVSNKSQKFTERILEAFGVRNSFRIVLGGDSLPEMKPSPAPILHALRGLGEAPAYALIIGDSTYDIEAAKAAGAASCAALYGFQDVNTLLDAKPDYAIRSFPEIASLPGVFPCCLQSEQDLSGPRADGA